MNTKKIKVSDFSTKPYGRFKHEGNSNGEKYRTEVLVPYFKQYDKIIIDLDGTYGYPSSFREEAFGGLARIYTTEDVLKKLDFISNNNPLIKDKIIDNIRKANIK
jgi:hypothetical protein